MPKGCLIAPVPACFDSEELKVEWYKLGTDFSFGVQEHFSHFSINGLDENFMPSVKLVEEHLIHQKHQTRSGIVPKILFFPNGMMSRKTQIPLPMHLHIIIATAKILVTSDGHLIQT